jgi:hypothetical protein
MCLKGCVCSFGLNSKHSVIFKARRLPHNATTVAIASRFQPQDLGDLAALLKSFFGLTAQS